MSNKKIGVLVGSLREESFSKKIAKVLAGLFPAGYDVEIIDISKLEIYNQDFDDQDRAPASYAEFRQKLSEQDAFLFVTPEYNRSVPAVLKNALDVGSRPYGHNLWGKKAGAIVSVSPGNLSAFGANHHLRQSLVFLDVQTLQQPEAYIANVHTLLAEDGSINNSGTLAFLQSIIDAFVALIEQLAK